MSSDGVGKVRSRWKLVLTVLAPSRGPPSAREGAGRQFGAGMPPAPASVVRVRDFKTFSQICPKMPSEPLRDPIRDADQAPDLVFHCRGGGI